MMRFKWNASMWVCLLTFVVPVSAEAPKDADAKGKAPKQETMDWAAFAGMATPGQHHEHLKPLEGTFDATVKMWMDPSMPPTESKGVWVRKWVLGGRQLQENYSGSAMGMPFEGIGFTGYDNMQKKYTSVWMDSMSTGTMVSTGTCDGKGKVIIFSGEAINPMTGKLERQKSVLRIVSQDSHVFEMYGTALDGKEFMSMQITCTRKTPSKQASSK